MPFTPICVGCEHEMRCRRNGYFFGDYGNAAIWSGDMYECERCKNRIVVGVGREPVVESNHPRFDAISAYSGFVLRREAT